MVFTVLVRIFWIDHHDDPAMVFYKDEALHDLQNLVDI